MNYFIRRFLILFFLFSSLLSFSQLAFSSDGTVLTTTKEFNFKEAQGFMPTEEIFSPVWHFKDSTYLVWIDPNFRAEITQIKNGVAVTVPLDENPDYVVQKDGHHRFSLGVDKLGYVHVTGDMHNYTDMTSGVITPYPARYQKKKILYWRSNKPNDITGKFSFRGDSFATAPQGSGWMMGKFFTDNNGELYYSSHVQAFRSSTNFGQMGVGLYKYNTTTQAWTTIGGVAPVSDPNVTYVFPVLYWEYSGFNHTQFQNYEPVFRFDKSNNLYFAVTSNTVPDYDGANRLIFAKSTDGGATWKRADGSAIASLPIRGISGLPSTGDVVLDTGSSNFLEPKPGLNIDKNGKPGVEIQNKWRVWDGKTWSLNNQLNYATMDTANTGFRLPNNDLIFNATGWNKLLRTPSFDTETIGYDFVGYDRLRCIDDFTIKSTGDIYGIGSTSDSETILKTTITPAPLPAGWADADIDTASLNFKGNAGYLNNRFVLTSYGQNIGDTADSFHFAYTKMHGDGEITARLTEFALANSSAGIMMRETLDPNSKQVSQLLYPNSSPQYSGFLARQSVGGYPLQIKINDIAAPYWLRLKRVGNTFSGFISPDGVTWKQTYSTSLPMASDIYIGLAATAGRFRYYMDGATFDNVSTPTDACTHMNPTVSLNPTSQSGNAGGTVNYAVSVVNNDSAACAPSDFSLSPTVPTNITANLDSSTLSIAAGKQGSANLKLTSSSSTAAGDYNFAIKASSGTYNGSANGVYSVVNSCILNAPTISIVPCSKTTSGLLPVNYVVTITSADSASCPLRVFKFSVKTSNQYLKSLMEPYNINMAPGDVNTSLLTLTPMTGLPLGSYPVSISTQNGGSVQATLTYEKQAAVIVQVTTDAPYYRRKATPFNAVLTVTVLENGQPVPNVPITATLTWPTGSKNLTAMPKKGNTGVYYVVIDPESPVGIYNFTATANYKGQNITNSVMFSVKSK